MFKIGEKVVCIDDENQYNITVRNSERVKKGEIYTVKGFTSISGVRLKEIHGGFFIYDNEEAGFKTERFRKLDHEFAENILAEITEAMQRQEILN